MRDALSAIVMQLGVSSLSLQLGWQLLQLVKARREASGRVLALQWMWASFALVLVAWGGWQQMNEVLDYGWHSGWAKVRSVISGLLYFTPSVVGWSLLALTLWLLVVALVVAGRVASKRRKWLLLAGLVGVITGPGILGWAVLHELSFLSTLEELMRHERVLALAAPRHTLNVAAAVATAGLLLAGLFAGVLVRGSQFEPRRPLGVHLVSGALLLAATVFLWRLGNRLQWEAEHPIDTTMAFANCGLCIPDRPGPLGRGPDDLVEAPHAELTRSHPRVDGSELKWPGELRDMLKAKRDLYQTVNPGRPAFRKVVLNVGDAPDVAALQAALEQIVDAGYDEVYFLFSELRHEQRPIVGELWGRRDTALAVRVARSRERCADLEAEPVPIALAAAEPLTPWLGQLVDAKATLNVKTPCLLLPVPECSPDGRRCQNPRAKGFTVTEQRSLSGSVSAMRIERGSEEYLVAFISYATPVQLRSMVDAKEPLGSFAQLDAIVEQRGDTLIWAMNAGMYQPDRTPVGLYVQEYQTEYPLNTRRGEGNFFLQPNGVFAFTKQRIPVVLRSEDFGYLLREAGQPRFATQSGPLLIEEGKHARKFDPESDSRFVRNGVGVDDNMGTVFVISTKPVTFYEFATAFLDLGCTDALYLDGSVSSLFAPKLGRRDSGRGLGPIVFVTAPKTETPPL